MIGQKLTPMKLNGDYYSTFIYLEPKTHEYKFVVDSDEILDPDNTNIVSNNAGGWNSQIDYSSMYQENTTQLLKSFKRNKTYFLIYMTKVTQKSCGFFNFIQQSNS